MKFSVEQPEEFQKRMKEELQIEFGPVQTEIDYFFQHPERDFHKTDECLRIRERNQNEYRITYKGPKLDILTKSREEIELPLTLLTQKNTLAEWKKLLERLGFTYFASVKKLRRKALFSFENRDYEMTLDEIPIVGTFTEIETGVDSDNPLDRDFARAEILLLAKKLHLETCIHRSYLGLFLDAQQSKS